MQIADKIIKIYATKSGTFLLRSFNSLLEIVRNYGKIISNNYGACTHYEWRRDMKKLLLCSLVVCCFPSFCFGFCGDNRISFQGNQAPGDDEFVYALTSDYEKSVIEEKNRNYSFALEGPVWECDDEQECKYYTAILAPSGHAWDKNTNRGETLYWCMSSFGDKWKEYELVPCGDNFYESLKKNPSLENNKIDMNGTTDKSVYRIDSNGGKITTFCYTDPERVACVKEEGTAWADGKCQCLELNGKKRSWNGRICVEVAGPSEPEENPVKPVNPVTPTPTQSCVQSRCGGLTGETYSQCITCCYVPSEVAVWNASEKVCKCTDSTEKFNPTTLQCEAENTVAPQPVQDDNSYECDPSKLQLLSQWIIQYSTDNTLITQINQILAYCDGVPSEFVFNNMFNNITVIINQSAASAAAASELTITQNRARENISSAVAKIEDIKSGLKLTVWRDEEGNFNTSRLLSDSIAGVVLGTAGGLITSNVVKKNQVENGFEDIQCSVGGQVVAGWGDEFRVGIQ